MALKAFTANSGTDQLTCTAHGFALGDVVCVYPIDAGVLPAPLVEAVPYHVIKIDANNVKLAVHAAAARYSTAIDLTSAGSGTLVLERVLA